MKSPFLLVAALLMGCSGADTTTAEFDPDVDGGPRAPAPLTQDGDPCTTHDECWSGVCVPVLPSAAEKRGVCWGPNMHYCVWVLFDDGVWSKDPCRKLGLTDMLCPPTWTPAMSDACVVPESEPAGLYPYDYVCCETTFTE